MKTQDDTQLTFTELPKELTTFSLTKPGSGTEELGGRRLVSMSFEINAHFNGVTAGSRGVSYLTNNTTWVGVSFSYRQMIAFGFSIAEKCFMNQSGRNKRNRIRSRRR